MNNDINLASILSKINDKNIMMNFLKDITTPKELNALQKRLNVVYLLNQRMSYAEIAKTLNTITTTITRIARFLKNEPYGGYRWVIDNILNKND